MSCFGGSSNCRKRDKLKTYFGLKKSANETLNTSDEQGQEDARSIYSRSSLSQSQSKSLSQSQSKSLSQSLSQTITADTSRKDYNQTGVMDLIDSNFKTFVSEQDVTLVLFYSTPGDDSIIANNRIEQGAQYTDRPYSAFARVDCGRNFELCEKEGVSNLPYFKLYSKGAVVGEVKDYTALYPSTMRLYVENCPVLEEAKRPTPISYTKSICGK